MDLEAEIRRHEATVAQLADTSQKVKVLRNQLVSLKRQLREAIDSVADLNYAWKACRGNLFVKRDSIQRLTGVVQDEKAQRAFLSTEYDSLKALLATVKNNEHSLRQALVDSCALLTTERKLRDQADAYARKIRKRLQTQPVFELSAQVSRPVNEQTDNSLEPAPERSAPYEKQEDVPKDDNFNPGKASEKDLPSFIWIIPLLVPVTFGVLLWFRHKLYNDNVRRKARGTINGQPPILKEKSNKSQLPNDLFKPR